GVPSKPGEVKFSKNVKLNDDTGKARQTEVAIATGPDGLVLSGWMDERASRVCAFSFSTDGGLTWSKNVSISNTANFVGDPAVAIDGGGTMYAICQQYTSGNGSSGNIKLRTSTDKGATWSEVSQIQSAPDKPWAAGGIKQGELFVSWLGNPGGIKRSKDGGKTWGPIQSTGNIIHGTGIVTSTTGLVHVPYNLDSNRNQLRYLRSKDNGETWEQPRDLLANMGTFCFSCNPRQHPIVGAAADPTGKFVAITWASKMTGGEGDDDVWLLYSKDGGDTWSQPIKVNDNKTASRQFESWVAVDSVGRVHVAWTDYRDGGKNETWYARSADPTKGFEPNIQVTDGSGSGSTDFLGDYKGIAVQGSDVLIVWQDTRMDQGDIFFARAAGAAAP
ncbi:MAG TPA: sialidase family protein, partial [Polyangiales bacterium]|nr:sialidase family protein [Polyangiales bacterium]